MSTSGVLMVVVVLLGVVSVGAYFLGRYRSTTSAEAQRTVQTRSPKVVDSRQVERSCRDALTIVDLVTPAQPGAELPSTKSLTSVGQRITHLNKRLSQLATGNENPRMAEAISDMRTVAMRLGAALEAERSVRLELDRTASDDQAVSNQEASVARIAERAAELDLIAREVNSLVDEPAG